MPPVNVGWRYAVNRKRVGGTIAETDPKKLKSETELTTEGVRIGVFFLSFYVIFSTSETSRAEPGNRTKPIRRPPQSPWKGEGGQGVWPFCTKKPQSTRPGAEEETIKNPNRRAERKNGTRDLSLQRAAKRKAGKVCVVICRELEWRETEKGNEERGRTRTWGSPTSGRAG